MGYKIEDWKFDFYENFFQSALSLKSSCLKKEEKKERGKENKEGLGENMNEDEVQLSLSFV